MRSPPPRSRSSGRPSTVAVGDGEHPQALRRQLLHRAGAGRRRAAQRRSTTSGAPLTTSRPSRRAAEKPRPAAKGRLASASPSAATPRSRGGLDDGPVGLVRLVVAVADGRRGEAQQAVLVEVALGADRHQPGHPQPVLGQRAGLVEADGVHPAQRLEHPGAADDGAAAGQPPGGGLLGDRRHQRQPLGHGGDGDGEARAHRLAQRPAPQHAEQR